MVVHAPFDKVLEIMQKIEIVLSKRKVTLRTMQSLIGVLQFTCRAIIPGRPFCRRLINATCGILNPYYHIRVTQNIKKDLEMWLSFFKQFNGISVFHDRSWISSADILPVQVVLALTSILQGNGHMLHGQTHGMSQD